MKEENKFDDTSFLADQLYVLAHDESLRLTGPEKYYIMEARETMLVLYEKYLESQNGKA